MHVFYSEHNGADVLELWPFPSPNNYSRRNLPMCIAYRPHIYKVAQTPIATDLCVKLSDFSSLFTML